MKKVTSIVIEQALEEVMFILSMHWTIRMNFRWWQLQSRIKSAERALQKDTIFRKSFASKAMKSFLEKKSWQIVP